MRTIKGTTRNDVITGTHRADWIEARDGDDEVHAGSGDDGLLGGNGNDRLYGDAGNDRLWGDAGDDRLWGGEGNDSLTGGAGADHLFGEAGADNFSTTAGDIVDGGAGDDSIMFLFNSTATGGDGNDFFHFQDRGTTTTITDYVPGEVLGLGYNLNDANASLAGNQGWEFVGTAPRSSFENGNGQATVNQVGDYTVLALYNADADGNLDVDLTIRLLGTYDAQAINLMHLSDVTQDWTDPALLFPQPVM